MNTEQRVDVLIVALFSTPCIVDTNVYVRGAGYFSSEKDANLLLSYLHSPESVVLSCLSVCISACFLCQDKDPLRYSSSPKRNFSRI